MTNASASISSVSLPRSRTALMTIMSGGVDATPFLTQIDSHLRCEICKHIYTAPIALKQCGHTFCSSCLRSHLNKGADFNHCPRCRASKVFESSFIKLPVLEAMAEAWRAEAQLVRAVEKERYAAAPSIPSASTRKSTSKRRASPDVDSDYEPAESSSAALRRSRRESTKRARPSPSDNATDAYRGAIEISDSEDETYEPGMVSGLSRPWAARSSRKEASSPPSGVECPLCMDQYPADKIEGHASRCNGESKTQPANGVNMRNFTGRPSISSSGFTSRSEQPPKEEKRMTRLHSKTTKPHDLRAALRDAGLPTTGPKDRLAERFSKYVDLHNANLDASDRFRKSASELLRALNDWERAIDAPVARHLGGRAHLKQYQEEFRDLVERARESHQANKRKRAAALADSGGDSGVGGGSDVGAQDLGQDEDVRMGSPDVEPPPGSPQPLHSRPQSPHAELSPSRIYINAAPSPHHGDPTIPPPPNKTFPTPSPPMLASPPTRL